MKNFMVFFIVVLILIPMTTYAEDVGTIVAVKGTVLIHRDNKSIFAHVKERILLKDTIETKEAARVKMLFLSGRFHRYRRLS